MSAPTDRETIMTTLPLAGIKIIDFTGAKPAQPGPNFSPGTAQTCWRWFGSGLEVPISSKPLLRPDLGHPHRLVTAPHTNHPTPSVTRGGTIAP